MLQQLTGRQMTNCLTGRASPWQRWDSNVALVDYEGGTPGLIPARTTPEGSASTAGSRRDDSPEDRVLNGGNQVRSSGPVP